MDLSRFLQSLMNNEPIGATATAAQVSAGGLHNVLTGKVKEPQPQTLARLATHFGNNDAERRLLYAEMMNRSGYFAMLPREMLATFKELQVQRDAHPTPPSDYDDLWSEVAAILNQANREQRARIALDVLRRFYPQEAQTLLETLQIQQETGQASPEADQ